MSKPPTFVPLRYQPELPIDRLILAEPPGAESLEVDVHRYPGTSHGFAEPDGETFDPDAFALAWSRTLDFLAKRLL